MELKEKRNNKGYYAFLTIPEADQDDVLKYDGDLFLGKNIKVKAAEPHLQPGQNQTNESFAKVAGSGDPNAPVSGDPGAEVLTKKFVEIDATVYNNCYKIPSQATMVFAVSLQFKEDRTKRLYSSYQGVWTLETDNISSYDGVQNLELDGVKLAKVTVRTMKSRVGPSGKLEFHRGDRENDLLVTLYKADTEKYKKVTREDILQKIADIGLGNLKRGLTQQTYKESDIPNGNLYFILSDIQPGDIDKIPHSFEFLTEDGVVRMWVNFKGKKRKCFVCSEIHDISHCPVKEMFDKMRAERDEISKGNGGAFKMKTWGSSVLRHVCQDALACDVDSMSGGTTGNILNAVGVDESTKAVENVLLVSGQNELNPRLSKEEFLWILKCKTERLVELAETKKVAILSPPPQGFVDAECQVRENIFHENLKSLPTLSKNIAVWDNPLRSYANDGGTHPSEEDTKTIIKFLDGMVKDTFDVPFLLPSATDDVITTDRIYHHVNSLYRYGCAACPSKVKNKWPLLCDVCVGGLKDHPDFENAVLDFDARVKIMMDSTCPPPATVVERGARGTHVTPPVSLRDRSPLKRPDGGH